MLIFSLLSGQLTIYEFAAIIVGILFGITIHEYAHAYVAYKCGDPTAKYMGRLSLNPLAHLDPIGTLALLTIGFGWGKPVPINPTNFSHKRDELKVAFAGIVTNIIAAFVLALPLRYAMLHCQLIDASPILSFLKGIVEINLVLAVFNLIPIPPLDGSHLVEYYLSHEQRYQYANIGPTILMFLILLSFVSGFSFFQVIVEPLVRILSIVVMGTGYISSCH